MTGVSLLTMGRQPRRPILLASSDPTVISVLAADPAHAATQLCVAAGLERPPVRAEGVWHGRAGFQRPAGPPLSQERR